MLGSMPVLDKRILRNENKTFHFGGSQIPKNTFKGESCSSCSSCNPLKKKNKKIYIKGNLLITKNIK